MYFRVNLKMKNPTLCGCFKWIIFIVKLNFTVAILLIRKTGHGWSVGKVGNFGTGGGGEVLLIGRWFWNGGGGGGGGGGGRWGGRVDTPLQTKVIVQISNQWCSVELNHWFRSLSNLSNVEVHIIIGYCCVRKSGICTRVMEIIGAAVS